MAGLRGLCVLALALPLGGCFSVTSVIAPKEVPGWALSPQAQYSEQPRVKVSRRAPQQRVVRREIDRADMPTITGNAAMPTHRVEPERTVVRPAARSTGSTGSPTAFSPEWHAQEDAAEAQLRRRMNICNGC